MSYRTIADFYKEDKNINKDCVNYFTKRNLNEVERDKKESYYYSNLYSSSPYKNEFQNNLNIENFSINNKHQERQDFLKNQQYLKHQESLKHQEYLKNQESLKRQESLKHQESLKRQEFLKNQETLKHQESLKHEDNLKYQEFLKRQDSLKNQQSLKNQESLKRQEFLKQQQSLKHQETPKSKETYLKDEKSLNNEKCSCGHEEFLKKEDNEKCLNINLEEKKVSTLTSPEIWGPALWFLLHNSSYNYDEKASPLAIERMKNFILGLPVMIPCKNCREHATAHIEKNMDKLEDVCSGRDNLFNFFVDFHNHVNKRYNKPEISYSDAKKLYSGKGEIKTFSYK